MNLEEVKAFAEITRRQADAIFADTLKGGCPSHSLFHPQAAAVMAAVASAPSTEEFVRLINIASPDSRTILQTVMLMGLLELRARHHELSLKHIEKHGIGNFAELAVNVDTAKAVSECKFGHATDTSALDAMAKRAEQQRKEAAQRRAAELN